MKRWMALALACAGLLTTTPHTALAQDGGAFVEHDRYWEQYSLGYTPGRGMLFNLRFTPRVESLGVRLNYENRQLGARIFDALRLSDVLPVDPPFIAEGDLGMLHVLWEHEDGRLRYAYGVGVGDRLRQLGDVGLVHTLALGGMGALDLALSEHLVGTLSLEWALSPWGWAGFDAGPQPTAAEIRSHDVRVRAEVQWGTVLGFGLLYGKAFSFEPTDRFDLPSASDDDVGDSQLGLYVALRQPIIESGLAYLFGEGAGPGHRGPTSPPAEAPPPARLSPEAQADVSGLPDFLLAISLFAGVTPVRGSDVETEFVRDQARLIAGGDDFELERTTLPARFIAGAWVTYFSPSLFYLALGGQFTSLPGSEDTRYIISRGQQERAFDLSRFSAGPAVKFGFYKPLFGQYAALYAGLAAGAQGSSFEARSSACSTDPERAFDSSCVDGQEDLFSSTSLIWHPWIQPHLGLTVGFSTLGFDIEVPDEADKVSVSGGFKFFLQVQGDFIPGTEASFASGELVRTASGKTVPLSLSNVAVVGGLGWAFGVGGN